MYQLRIMKYGYGMKWIMSVEWNEMDYECEMEWNMNVVKHDM